MTEVFITNDYVKGRLARQIPGAWYVGSAHGDVQPGWFFDPEAHEYGAAVARALFPDLRAVLPPATEASTRPTDLATPWFEAGAHLGHLQNVPGNMLDAMYPFQRVDLAYTCARLRNDGGAELGWDTGLGKTFGAFSVGMELGARRTLVISNRKAKQNIWIPEVAKWKLPITWFDIGGTKAQRDRTVQAWAWSDDPWPWAIIHPEALRLIDFSKLPPIDLIIFDEAHKMSHGGTSSAKGVPQYYKALKKIKSTYRLALSGSIVINGMEDMFGTLHWILPQKYKSKWRDWNDRYLVYVQGSGHKTLVDVNRSRLDEMRNELGAFITVRYKNDELKDVPEVIERDLLVDLGPQQQRVYDEMAEHFVANMPDGERLRADNVMVQLTRLRQIACGLTLLDGGASPGEAPGLLVDNAKVEAAVGLVEDNLPHKTVVFAWHRATADAFAQSMAELGINCAKVYGGMTDRASTAEITAFQTEPNCPVFVGTIASVGESINLNAASDVVFIESDWTPAKMKQARDRVAGGFRQQGKTRRIMVTTIMSRGTVDVSRVLPALTSKAALRALVFGEPAKITG